MNRSADEVAEVPLVVVTVISIAPLPDGAIAISSVVDTKDTAEAGVLPNWTLVADTKLVPLMVTAAPPLVGPSLGDILLIVGGGRTWYTATVLLGGFVIRVNKFFATSGENAIEVGPDTIENGEPKTGVKIPVAKSTEYKETLSLPKFVTAANKFPSTSGENATEEGCEAAENGEPVTV